MNAKVTVSVSYEFADGSSPEVITLITKLFASLNPDAVVAIMPNKIVDEPVVAPAKAKKGKERLLSDEEKAVIRARFMKGKADAQRPT